MKHIKKFNSISDLEENESNIAPQEYYLEISENGDSFSYYLVGEQYIQDANFTGTTKGIFGEIIPGVAYLDDSGDKYVLYNNQLPLVEVSASAQTYTWAQFDMTRELYDKYLASAKTYTHPSTFNIFIGGNAPGQVEYVNGMQGKTQVEELRFTSGCWALSFDSINETVRAFYNCE